MKILPSEEYCLETNLNEDEVINRIKSIIEPPKNNNSLFKKEYSKPYSGYIKGNKFEIVKNIEGVNSMMPNIFGEIVNLDNKRIINIKAKLNKYVYGFSIFWLILIILFLFIGIFFKDFILTISSIMMFVFGLCLINGGFSGEKYEIKEYLKKLLEASEKENLRDDINSCLFA